jgi:alanine racemase
LAQIGTVLINGRLAPIIGGICMDACFVKVTKFEGLRVGDIVTLMGREREKEISPHDIADTIDSVSYEIISRFGKRLPRVYVRDERVVGVKSILSVNSNFCPQQETEIGVIVDH